MRHVVVLRALAIVAVVAMSTVAATEAGALWSASTAPGTVSSPAATMPGGNQPTATVTPPTATTVDLSWTASTGGAPVAGYQVRAYDATTGNPRTVAGTCADTPTGTTCNDTAVPAGSWRYSITPRQQAWAGAESPRSTAVTVQP